MTAEPRDSGVLFSGFFARCRLPASAREECDAFAKDRFPGVGIRPVPFQGYCSYTVCAGDAAIVQFRPVQHQLDLATVAAARTTFGSLVPATKSLGPVGGTGLHAYALQRLAGPSLGEFRARDTRAAVVRAQRRRIVQDFASFHATAWKHAKAGADVIPKGTVGSSIRWRLDLMARSVPGRLQRFVTGLVTELPAIEALPWALSHGDFLPSNILVSPDEGAISGLLDWAEAEYLPFGVGMYGLEELLGADNHGVFAYYEEAHTLRRLFWSVLLSEVPKLRNNPKLLKTVKAAQTLGVLLWNAIAFDNGQLNRAVEEGRDSAEIQKLDVFLLDPRSSQGSLIARLKCKLSDFHKTPGRS